MNLIRELKLKVIRRRLYGGLYSLEGKYLDVLYRKASIWQSMLEIFQRLEKILEKLI